MKLCKLSTLLQVQQVCKLFWNIVQDFVANGDLKTDYYCIRRPFQELNFSQENDAVYFYKMNQDQVKFKSKVPIWLLGAGFHGPYTTSDEISVKNFEIQMRAVETSGNVLQERYKHCKVKFPAVILPLFFQKPIRLDANICYVVSMLFTFSQDFESRCYVIEYQKTQTVEGQYTFDEENCVMKETCQCAYVQCGHIRFLYIWPINTTE